MAGARKIALALGGGGARGISHVHVLKAIDDMGLEVCEIAGSSIGAIVGSGYAAGMTGLQIEEHFRSTFSSRSSVIGKLWRITPGVMSRFTRSRNMPFGQMNIEDVLEEFLPGELPRDFSELKIPLTITGTDFYGSCLKKLTIGDLRKAIAASAAIPVVFAPVVIDGCTLIDGGINNPLPFDLLETPDAVTVAVDVVGLPLPDNGRPLTRINAGFGASQLMMQAVTNLKLQQSPPDLFLRPPADGFRVMDFLKVNEILEVTAPVYDEARRGLERLLAKSDTGVSA